MSLKAGAGMKRRIKTKSDDKATARKTLRTRRARIPLPKANSGLQSQNEALKRELTEAVEQQTATSEILGVISSSPGELGAVFDKILDNAIRICSARFGNLFLYRDGEFTAVKMRNAPAEFLRARTERPNRPGPDTALGRVERTKQPVQIADLRAEPQYKSGEPFAVSGAEIGGIRSLVSVPMLKDG